MSPRIGRVAAALAFVAALGLSVAACSGPAATPGASPVTSATPTSAASDAASPGASSGVTGKVSANTATADELASALTAAGVPNADRWAREIQEYRPYPTVDPTLQKLQDNLAKYDPDPATLAAILSALEP